MVKFYSVWKFIAQISKQDVVDAVTEDLEITEEFTEAPATDSPEEITVILTEEPEVPEIVETTDEEVLLIVTTEQPAEETVELLPTESLEPEPEPTMATVAVETTALAPTTASVEPTPSSIQPGTSVSVNLLPCNVAPCLNGGQCLLTAKEGWQVIHFIHSNFNVEISFESARTSRLKPFLWLAGGVSTWFVDCHFPVSMSLA